MDERKGEKGAEVDKRKGEKDDKRKGDTGQERQRMMTKRSSLLAISVC